MRCRCRCKTLASDATVEVLPSRIGVVLGEERCSSRGSGRQGSSSGALAVGDVVWGDGRHTIASAIAAPWDSHCAVVQSLK